MFQRADPRIIIQPMQVRRMENSEKALDWASGSRVPFLVTPTRLCDPICTAVLSGPDFPTGTTR